MFDINTTLIHIVIVKYFTFKIIISVVFGVRVRASVLYVIFVDVLNLYLHKQKVWKKYLLPRM
jgi:hypothetical protein